MSDISVWVATAAREPSEALLTRLDRRWRDGVQAAKNEDCVWLRDAMHSFVLAHVDRAAYRRRLRTVFLTGGETHEHCHGFTPMSDLVTGDMFGPQEIDARHTGDDSPLAAAISLAKTDPHVLAVPVITERTYTDVDEFFDHAATTLRADVHGAVLPVLYAPMGEDLDEVDARENLLRAGGFATYTVDVDFTRDEPHDIHASVALLLEDALDSIAHLKADTPGLSMLGAPTWPLITVRADQSWDPDRCREQTLETARKGTAGA
ncbi:hypothetical protein [Demequina globuliformis]|uniref:hypothetical protein n=1 Tax=Demequina globuliformis TaxID=676202 RepID=UPI000784E7F8|nr:hypothetical protein [Demequina globuliformis]